MIFSYSKSQIFLCDLALLLEHFYSIGFIVFVYYCRSEKKQEQFDHFSLKTTKKSRTNQAAKKTSILWKSTCTHAKTYHFLLLWRNKSNRVRTIDAFSSSHIQVFVLVFVLILVTVLLTVAWLVIISCYIPSCTITLLKIGQIRDFNSCVTDRPTNGRTYPLIEMRERI